MITEHTSGSSAEEQAMMKALQAYVRWLGYLPRGAWLDAHFEIKVLDDDIAVRRVGVYVAKGEKEPDFH